jgi:hypothetical protein
MRTHGLALALAASMCVPVLAQDRAAGPRGAKPAESGAAELKSGAAEPGKGAGDAAAEAVSAAVAQSYSFILSHQESLGDDGSPRAEWPYEGVYREGGKIPIGYRVGGTGICARALLENPAFKDDAAAREALLRARDFIVGSIADPAMSPEYDIAYDVRGWGYTYGLDFLLRAKRTGLVDNGVKEAVEKAIRFFIDAIQKTEIPQVGGWNYSRPGGTKRVSAPSPFMTAPTLMALFEARRAGYEVDAAVVERGLTYLESAHEPSGAVVYSGSGEKKKDGVPGAVGRMLASETALYLAGRSTQRDLRAAVDAFIVHWEWLDKRRAKTGTHKPPYMIAPYYFYYAHYFAAQAIELLPEHERAEYRRRVNDLLFSVRLKDGSWNDRVFPRTASYSTAMASMALMMPDLPRPASWKKD